jgi:NADPH:quinone reductase-like Zn-dependent oxidoreductase
LKFPDDPATEIVEEKFLKAVQIHRHGGVEQLCYEECAEPELKSPSDAIIKLKAAALNPIDIRTRRGLSGSEFSFPHILGGDGAGIVVSAGKEARNVKAGDAICLFPAAGCGRCEFCVTDRETSCNQLRILGEGDNGTYAEYVRVPSRNCFPIPAGLSFEEAAAFPLVFVTAWRMLYTDARLRPGEWILIIGIGGGVATAALRLAVQLGAHVIVTSRSDDKLTLAKTLGAEQGINSGDGNFVEAVRHLTRKRGVDVVVDCVGGDSWSKSLAALARGGRLVTCGASAGSEPKTDLQRIFWNHLKIFGSTLGSRQEFHQVLKLMEVTPAKPVLDEVFQLRDAAKAQQRLEAGKQFGKIVLRMDN